jgi:hypothetical protein
MCAAGARIVFEGGLTMDRRVAQTHQFVGSVFYTTHTTTSCAISTTNAMSVNATTTCQQDDSPPWSSTLPLTQVELVSGATTEELRFSDMQYPMAADEPVQGVSEDSECSLPDLFNVGEVSRPLDSDLIPAPVDVGALPDDFDDMNSDVDPELEKLFERGNSPGPGGGGR